MAQNNSFNGNLVPWSLDVDQEAVNVFIEPVVAYRCWLVDGFAMKRLRLLSMERLEALRERPAFQLDKGRWHPDLKLRSTNSDEFCWPSREKAAATLPDIGQRDLAGIYGWKHRRRMQVYAVTQRELNTPAFQVVEGEVYLWGEVVEHELGYRAQFAYPKQLYRSRNSSWLWQARQDVLTVMVADYYGVPTVQVGF